MPLQITLSDVSNISFYGGQISRKITKIMSISMFSLHSFGYYISVMRYPCDLSFSYNYDITANKFTWIMDYMSLYTCLPHLLHNHKDNKIIL